MTKIIKEFKHEVDNKEIKIATEILHHAGTNPESRQKIEIEQEAWRTVNAMFEDKEKKFIKQLKEQKQQLDESKKQNEALLKELEMLKQKLSEK